MGLVLNVVLNIQEVKGGVIMTKSIAGCLCASFDVRHMVWIQAVCLLCLTWSKPSLLSSQLFS
jgi:hypothetical protein